MDERISLEANKYANVEVDKMTSVHVKVEMDK